MLRERNINLELEIEFKSPFIVGSGFGLAGLVDLTTVRYSDNIVYLPASSLKGKIRSEFKKNMETLSSAGAVCNSIVGNKTEICKVPNLAEACVICRVFGSELYEGSLTFEDGVMDSAMRSRLVEIEGDNVMPVFQSSVRTGTRINRWLRIVEEGALFTCEGVNPVLVFTSHIHGSCFISGDEYVYLKQTIATITHLGGNKARGMGRCCLTVKESAS